jgi:uncharacterized membrane protein
MGGRTLHRVLLLLALAGIGIAGYLTYVHYEGLAPICAVGRGCEKVQSSRYAKLAGVPVPLVGLAGYLGILASLLARGELARLATAAMAYVGVAFSGYLTFLELFRIHAICQWCVGSAVVMTAIALLATARVLRAEEAAALDVREPLAAQLEREPA